MPFPNLNGRPSSYTDDVPQKVAEFVKLELEAKNLPTRAGLANYIGITKETLIRWGEQNKQLSDALSAFDQLQENEVWQRALRGEYNSNIAKLLLYNHGYSERSETKTETTLKIEELDDEARRNRIAETERRIAQLEDGRRN